MRKAGELLKHVKTNEYSRLTSSRLRNHVAVHVYTDGQWIVWLRPVTKQPTSDICSLFRKQYLFWSSGFLQFSVEKLNRGVYLRGSNTAEINWRTSETEEGSIPGTVGRKLAKCGCGNY